MAGSGSVVTAAGLLFAFTMASFIFSDLRVLGQIGTTIALGLLFDTLIVRSFMTPSIAALLGRWFWWRLALLWPIARSRAASSSFSNLASRSRQILTQHGPLHKDEIAQHCRDRGMDDPDSAIQKCHLGHEQLALASPPMRAPQDA
jgi:hypothetical protein